MDAFSPITAIVGGLLIGLASAVLWLGNGRIAGISGIFGQLLPPARTIAWRVAFLVSLIAGALVASWLVPGIGVGGPGGQEARLVEAPTWFEPGTVVWLALAGLLTGFGTKIGNGCTSGHGVCGLARLSVRSMVAVLIFFVIAIVTVTITGVV